MALPWNGAFGLVFEALLLGAPPSRPIHAIAADPSTPA